MMNDKPKKKLNIRTWKGELEAVEVEREFAAFGFFFFIHKSVEKLPVFDHQLCVSERTTGVRICFREDYDALRNAGYTEHACRQGLAELGEEGLNKKIHDALAKYGPANYWHLASGEPDTVWEDRQMRDLVMKTVCEECIDKSKCIIGICRCREALERLVLDLSRSEVMSPGWRRDAQSAMTAITAMANKAIKAAVGKDRQRPEEISKEKEKDLFIILYNMIFYHGYEIQHELQFNPFSDNKRDKLAEVFGPYVDKILDTLGLQRGGRG